MSSDSLKLSKVYFSSVKFSMKKDLNIKVRKRTKISNRYNLVPHLTHDTTQESDKKHNEASQMEPRGRTFPSRLPQGSNEWARKHDKHKI